mgnify:CR=1 FL=1
MENKEKFQGSCGKRKKEGQFEEELTESLAKAVNTGESVNELLTLHESVNTLHKFKSPLQRISEDHRLKAEIVAEEHKRKSFNEVLDVYEFCYDFVKELSKIYGVPLFKVPDTIRKYIPMDEKAVLGTKLSEFLDDIGVNGRDRKLLEPKLYAILFDIKFRKKPAREVLKPLLVLERGDSP